MSIFVNHTLRQTIINAKIILPQIISSCKSINKWYGIREKFNQQLTTRKCNYSTSTTNNAFNIDTNVAKDVILFKYDNPKFFNVLNAFAICQFIFWNYLSHFAFTTLKDAPTDKVDDNAPWYRKINLGENKYRNTITVVCFLIGYGILASAWLFTLRSIRFLILRKGGKEVCFVTYGPFNKNRMMDVPLKCVSAQESRQSAKVQLPIKIKNKSFFYILDMRGEFLNQKLFDYTVGLKRKF